MQKLDSSITQNFQPLMDHFDFLDTIAKNSCTSTAGLAIGTSSTAAIKIANTTTYLTSGLFASKATAEVAFTATVMDIPANATSVQEQVYLVTLSANGTPTITVGGITTGSGTAPLPPRPTTGTPIGYVRIAVNAGTPSGSTNFVAGTTALSDARLSAVTYTNVARYSARFDTAQ